MSAYRFKAVVRRRRDEDDDWVPVEDRWPAEFIWVVDWERHDLETGVFVGGCVTPFETHAEALQEAITEADAARRALATIEARPT